MRRLRRGLSLRPIPVALALLLASAAAQAQAPDELMLLDLCLNARCSGIAAVVVRGQAVLVDREALLAAGLDPTALTAQQIDGRAYVDPAQLGQGIEVVLDRANLRVDLVQRASDMPAQTIDLRTRGRADAGTRPWTAFVNYAAAVGDGRSDGEVGLETLFLDAAAGRGPAALRSTGYWDPDNGWRRGLTRLEIDQPNHLRRWTVGDQVAVARDPLGGGALLGGVGMERAFDQDPYLVTFPQPFYQGVIETPGVVEVYANGALIGRREVGAGPFNLQNLGVPPGRSDVRVVLRDPFGNRRDLAAASYYGGSALLAPGLSDYALRLGRVRGGSLDGDYGDDTAWQAWYRRGVSDRITLGVRSEGDEDFANAGADAALRTNLGEFGFALARSRDDDAGSGHAASISYSYGGPRAGLSLGSRRFSSGYRMLGTTFELFGARLREDAYANLSWSPATRLSMQLGYGRQRREGLPAERTASLSSTWRLSPAAQLLLSVQRSDGLFEDTSALLSLNVALDRDSLAFSVRDRRSASDDGVDGDSRGYGFDARRSRPVGIGWGYDASVQHDDFGTSGFGQLEYEGRHGRYAVQADRFGGRSGARVLLNGALVGIGGRAYATPPLDSGFAWCACRRGRRADPAREPRGRPHRCTRRPAGAHLVPITPTRSRSIPRRCRSTTRSCAARAAGGVPQHRQVATWTRTRCARSPSPAPARWRRRAPGRLRRVQLRMRMPAKPARSVRTALLLRAAARRRHQAIVDSDAVAPLQPSTSRTARPASSNWARSNAR